VHPTVKAHKPKLARSMKQKRYSRATTGTRCRSILVRRRVTASSCEMGIASRVSMSGWLGCSDFFSAIAIVIGKRRCATQGSDTLGTLADESFVPGFVPNPNWPTRCAEHAETQDFRDTTHHDEPNNSLGPGADPFFRSSLPEYPRCGNTRCPNCQCFQQLCWRYRTWQSQSGSDVAQRRNNERVTRTLHQRSGKR
jgi:hypothetical protein